MCAGARPSYRGGRCGETLSQARRPSWEQPGSASGSGVGEIARGPGSRRRGHLSTEGTDPQLPPPRKGKGSRAFDQWLNGFLPVSKRNTVVCLCIPF